MSALILSPGANAAVPAGKLTIEVALTPTQVDGAEVDISAFLLGSNGKVRGDTDMVFYGQRSPGNNSVTLTDTATGRAWFLVNLSHLDSTLEKIALTATIHENRQRFGVFTELSVTIKDASGQPIVEARLPATGMTESALILGEFYLRQGLWKFRAIGQGFAGGLPPLAQHFGVDISDSAPATAAPLPPPIPAGKPISLSKITLDKSKPSISLEKKASGFGEIKINLNWNRQQGEKNKGMLGGLFSKNKSIDLDLACLFEMQDGSISGVQALGNAFGNFHGFPYIELKGDDRTGAISDGEWLSINGQHWDKIKRVLIFSFIYEGVANWAATDGVVTIYVPNEPPIEVRLTEGSNRLNTCSIALLENHRGAIRVNHEVRYFAGARDMDRAYHWGLNWTSGSKD